MSFASSREVGSSVSRRSVQDAIVPGRLLDLPIDDFDEIDGGQRPAGANPDLPSCVVTDEFEWTFGVAVHINRSPSGDVGSKASRH